jgi:DNA-directed RNA polymerase subunit RPC12/RpoP
MEYSCLNCGITVTMRIRGWDCEAMRRHIELVCHQCGENLLTRREMTRLIRRLGLRIEELEAEVVTIIDYDSDSTRSD